MNCLSTHADVDNVVLSCVLIVVVAVNGSLVDQSLRLSIYRYSEAQVFVFSKFFLLTAIVLYFSVSVIY